MNQIGINIWDDFSEDEGSYAAIDSESSVDEQKKILEYVLPQIKSYFLPKVELSLCLYDTKKEYPDFNRTPENILNTGWKDYVLWKINIKHISYEELEEVMEDRGLSKLTLSYEGKEIIFYSES